MVEAKSHGTPFGKHWSKLNTTIVNQACSNLEEHKEKTIYILSLVHAYSYQAGNATEMRKTLRRKCIQIQVLETLQIQTLL